MIVYIAAPVALVAKVRTAVAGRSVPAWVRAGHRSSGKMRPMSVSDFFAETAAKAVEGVTPSSAALAWAEEKIAKGRENHAIATKERWEERRQAKKARR